MIKKKKKTFIVQAILTDHNARASFKNGSCVIATKEVTFTDDRGTGFKGPMFTVAILNMETKFREELLSFKWKE